MPVESVLVVDDSATTRAFLEAALVAAGYAVRLAADGAQAIRMFGEARPDLVLLDVVMPGMDGYEVCKQIRVLPQGVDVPIVFLTGLREMDSHKKALEVGADDLLTKPISRTELMLRVRSMAWMHRLRSDLRNGYNLIRSQRDALMHVQQQKDELTNLIIHDLKNPLTNILGYGELLQTGDAAITARLPEISGYIMESGRLMMRLIMNMLDIKRSEDGALIPKMKEVNMAALLEDLKRNMGGLLAIKKLNIEIARAPDVYSIQADSDLLWRLLENLADNAIRYAPAGSTIRVEARHLKNQDVELRVCDEGAGVPPEHREKIFAKYVQTPDAGQSGAQQSRSNMGLGLTFCRLAAEAHGGKIWVEENQPKGAAFCVCLPHSAEHSAGPSAEVLNEPPPAPSRA